MENRINHPPIRCFVIEDEPIIYFWIKKVLSKYDFVTICGHASKFSDAVNGIRDVKPELILADVILEDCNIFDILPEVIHEMEFHVIFMTSFEEYALKAIKFNAVDYLLKPLEEENLIGAIEQFQREKEKKVQNYKSLIEYLTVPNIKKRISLPFQNFTELIELDNIIYLEADINYSLVYLKDSKPILVSKTLKEFQQLLAPEVEFIRIHQSYLINLNHVKKIIRTKLPQVVMSNGDVVNVSRSNKKVFLDRFSI